AHPRRRCPGRGWRCRALRRTSRSGWTHPDGRAGQADSSARAQWRRQDHPDPLLHGPAAPVGWDRAGAGRRRGYGRSRWPGRVHAPEHGRLVRDQAGGAAALSGRAVRPAVGRGGAQPAAGHRRLRPDAVPAALRRPAAGGQPGRCPGGATGAGVPGRADRRHGSACPQGHVGAAGGAAFRRGHHRAHHPQHGGGAAARRLRVHRRPRPGGRGRHCGPAHRRRSDAGAGLPGQHRRYGGAM
ncbi:MAG: Efflux ABC transporter, ATP-binding protein, partial [uncultured Propionibacteriaceae bacterium]